MCVCRVKGSRGKGSYQCDCQGTLPTVRYTHTQLMSCGSSTFRVSLLVCGIGGGWGRGGYWASMGIIKGNDLGVELGSK